jgi:hypothetical protein
MFVQYIGILQVGGEKAGARGGLLEDATKGGPEEHNGSRQSGREDRTGREPEIASLPGLAVRQAAYCYGLEQTGKNLFRPS